MCWYTGNSLYDTILFSGFTLVILTMIGTRFFKTPYGRFGDKRFGIALNPRLGWFLMELPATVTFIIIYFNGIRSFETVPLVFFVIWCIHYANRGFIFPFLMRVDPGSRQTFNLAVVASGWVVTAIHGYLNASFFTTHGNHFTASWLSDPRFIIGILFYYFGYSMNIYSDYILRNLRSKDRDTRAAGPRYSIPDKGLFRLVTNPHYLGELIAWAGFALMTWSLAGVFIFLITAANLIPRSRENHAWYHDTFEHYPEERKILLPWTW